MHYFSTTPHKDGHSLTVGVESVTREKFKFLIIDKDNEDKWHSEESLPVNNSHNP